MKELVEIKLNLYMENQSEALYTTVFKKTSDIAANIRTVCHNFYCLVKYYQSGTSFSIFGGRGTLLYYYNQN